MEVQYNDVVYKYLKGDVHRGPFHICTKAVGTVNFEHSPTQKKAAV